MKSLFDKLPLFIRLLVIIGGTLTLIFMALITINYYMTAQVTYHRAGIKNRLLAENIAENIEQRLIRIEELVKLTAKQLMDSQFDIDHASKNLERTMQIDPLIYGMCVLRSQKYMEKKNGKTIYCFRDSETQQPIVALRKDVAQDYTEDWYVLPYHLKKGVWVEPYTDNDNGTLMITFGYPLTRESDSEIIAIITGDLALDDLWKVVDKKELHGVAHTCVISRQGVFIAHENPNYLMRETIISLAQHAKDKKITQDYYNVHKVMTENFSGETRGINLASHDLSYYYYHAIPSLGGVACVYVSQKELNSTISEIVHISWLIGAAGLLLVIGFSYLIARAISKPLTALADAAKHLLLSHFKHPVPAINGSTEVITLRNALEELRKSTEKHIVDIRNATAAKEKISSELAIARDIQMGIVPKLFPAFPQHPQVDLFAKLQPALEVGGDLYDFLMLDENHVYIAIGDVSGKGVPASLLMAVTKTLLKTSIINTLDPARAVTITNQEIASHNDACMFVTLFCGIIDIRTGEMVYTNAGHNPPMIFRADSGLIELLTTSHGPAIGVIEDLDYKSNTVNLFAKDELLLYTDGITEAMNPEMQIYSEERLAEWFKENALQGSSTEIILRLYHEINQYASGMAQWDDMTTLMVRGCSQQTSADAAVTYNHMHVSNHISELPEIITWVERNCESVGVAADVYSKIHLVAEEWFVNIINHAYTDQKLHFVDIKFWRNEDNVYLYFEDDGQVFDPATFNPEPIHDQLDERHLGGLGVFFIKEIMDEVIYVREKDRNKLTLIYHLNKSHPPLNIPAIAPEKFAYASTEIRDDFVIVNMPEQLDISTATQLQKQLLNFITHGKIKLACNFAHTRYVSSAGLRVMLLVAKKLKKGDGTFILYQMSKDVYEPFVLAQFHTFMDIREEF